MRFSEISNELHDYYARVVQGRQLTMRPPADGIKFWDGGGSIVMHRDGQFQCELMFHRAGAQIPEHRHPNVEALDVMISGDVYACREGVIEIEPKEPRPNGTAHDFMRAHPFPFNCLHGGGTGTRGACVLSVQRWREGVVLTSITDTQGKLNAT